jgi:hypothetical protein
MQKPGPAFLADDATSASHIVTPFLKGRNLPLEPTLRGPLALFFLSRELCFGHVITSQAEQVVICTYTPICALDYLAHGQCGKESIHALLQPRQRHVVLVQLFHILSPKKKAHKEKVKMNKRLTN